MKGSPSLRSYLPHLYSPPSLTHLFNEFGESRGLNWFHQSELIKWPLKITSQEVPYRKTNQDCYCSIHSSIFSLSSDSATLESHSRNRYIICNMFFLSILSVGLLLPHRDPNPALNLLFWFCMSRLKEIKMTRERKSK